MARKITDYYMVDAPTPRKLAENVRSLIEKGAQPYYGPVAFPGDFTYDGEVITTGFLQAMVTYESEEE